MKQPHYGIDAPGLVRFFFIAGSTALMLLIAVFTTAIVGPVFRLALSVLFGSAAFYLLSMGGLMLYSSKVMKLKDNEKLLNLISWTGSERVLDIGCGRGLMLIGAAKRLTTGNATGIDLWQEKDQANNSAFAAHENATIEGVAQRIEIQTADMRNLPFKNNQFDVITSNWTIHNLEVQTDRQETLKEIVRVLKPGGIVIINDIVNQAEYAKYLAQQGLKSVQLHNNGMRDTVLKIVSFGSFVPSAVSGRKDA